MSKLTPMSVVKHFKGDLYIVLGVAEHTETQEQLVAYRPFDGDRKLYVRPLDMFNSDVDMVKYPEAKQKERFEYVAPLVEVLRSKAV